MPQTLNNQQKLGQKILVVEDEGEMSLILDLILNERKIQADYVSSLLAADEYLENEKPGLVILDNKLPDGYGVDFISYLKKKYPGIKIIMISGFPSVGDVAIENGANAFLEKPFSLEEFNKAIDKILE